jgi:hypothetical protein
MARYPVLPSLVKQALTEIEPSRCDDLFYFPCRAILKNGDILDTVYVVPEIPYLKMWGMYPEDDRAKRWIQIENILAVEDSPTRLPARFANKLYENGESGMGYCIFTIVFANGERQACVSGNAIDFVRYPDGKSAEDVVDVLPHEGRRDDSLVKSPQWYWCLYSEEQ